MRTDIKASDGTEIRAGDLIEVRLPEDGLYSGMIIARGAVFLERGSFRVPCYENGGGSVRLSDLSVDCVITII